MRPIKDTEQACGHTHQVTSEDPIQRIKNNRRIMVNEEQTTKKITSDKYDKERNTLEGEKYVSQDGKS